MKGQLLHVAVICMIVVSLNSAAVAVEYLKTEPPLGMLKTGQSVLVDDGFCPTGQVRKVTGGNGGAGGHGVFAANRQGRSSVCVPRR